MKHLKNFLESVDTEYQDIMDNFAYICDVLGEPKVESNKWSGLYKKWKFTWGLGVILDNLQDPSNIITRLKSIIEDFEDIISAKERIENYEIKMAISNTSLIVVAIPNEVGDSKYEFIGGQKWREIFINITDVERYLKSKSIDIKKTDNKYEEYAETSSVQLDTTEISPDIRTELKSMFDSEAKSKTIDRIDYNSDRVSGGIDRSVEISVGVNFITFTTYDEKTFIGIL